MFPLYEFKEKYIICYVYDVYSVYIKKIYILVGDSRIR